MPEFETVIACVVAPVDHKLPVVEEDVNITFPPAQKLNDPLFEIVGMDGIGFTVTTVGFERPEEQPNSDFATE